MMAASMMFYLNHIVAPYVMFLRVTRQDPALMVHFVMVKRKNKGKSPLHLAFIRLTVQKLADFGFASIHSFKSSPSARAWGMQDRSSLAIFVPLNPPPTGSSCMLAPGHSEFDDPSNLGGS
jgi:hypothetical protein